MARSGTRARVIRDSSHAPRGPRGPRARGRFSWFSAFVDVDLAARLGALPLAAPGLLGALGFSGSARGRGPELRVWWSSRAACEQLTFKRGASARGTAGRQAGSALGQPSRGSGLVAAHAGLLGAIC